MWSHIVIMAVALFTLDGEAVAAAKGTSGSQQAKSIAGSREGCRRSANGDHSHSGQARGLDQSPSRNYGHIKGEWWNDDEVAHNNGREARKARAEWDEETEDYDHVETSRAARRRRLNASGAGDRNDNRVEEADYWEDGGDGENEYSGVDFDLLEDDLLDSDDDRHEESVEYDEEEIQHFKPGDDSKRSGRRLQRWDDGQGAALDGGVHPSRRRADSRRPSSSRAMPPSGREKKTGSMMKSVGSATGKSAKALVHALQPKSVGLGEILDTWKIEQVIGKPPGRVMRCAATVEFRRDGTVATSFEGRDTVSEFTFRSHSWPRACTIEFEARAFQGPWDEEPVWKVYKGFFSRKLLDPKVVTLEGAIYEETGKMLWKRRVKVGKFIGRRRPSRASRGGSNSKGIGGGRFVDGVGFGGARRGGYRGQREHRSGLRSDRGAVGGGESTRSSHREAGARRRGSKHVDDEL